MIMLPTNQTEAVVHVCDRLLEIVGELGHLTKEAGGEWPNARVASVIDRILDIRNHAKPTTQKTNHEN